MRRWIARQVLKREGALAAILRVPVLGTCVRALGQILVPRRSMAWAKIEDGAANGLWMELNPRSGANYVRGGGEPKVQAFIAGHLKPGMVFYDLGANSGFFSLIAARCVGKSGHVYSFEPEHELAERIRSNMQRNQFDRFTIVESAVWRETGHVSFARSDRSISPDQGTGQVTTTGNGAQTIQVPTVALDDFAAGALPPDLIKCDVEGAEVEVFRGATRLLASCRPIIVCEIHSVAIGEALRRDLRNLGYVIQDLDENHIGASTS
jgi:FkbM family methyltransferase